MNAIENEVREYVYAMTDAPECISERNIAQKFELKRNVVREIFLAMEGEGILQRIPNVGYKLVNYGDSDARTRGAVRYTVEREAARKALSNATREDILRMTLILEEMEEILKGKKGDSTAFYKDDMDFHRALVDSSHDNMLIKIFSFITTPIFKTPAQLSELATTHENHIKILEAIKNKDEESIMKLMNMHLGNYEKHTEVIWKAC